MGQSSPDYTIMETGLDHSVNLTDLLEHSHAMLGHAEAGEWKTVVKDEMTRRQLIDRFFSKASNLADEAELRHCLQELLKINDRLQQLAAHARDQVKAEVNTISEGRKAVNAYAENSR
jgi:hypothetical protein